RGSDHADWDREKERDHADRFRTRRGASTPHDADRGDLRRLHHSVPPHHDDHDGGAAWRAPDRARVRFWRRGPPAARVGRGRRTGGLAADHAVSHSGRLHLPGRSGENTSNHRRAGGRLPRSAMNISEGFIRRPIATSLLMAAIVLFGFVAYRSLPVSDLPNVDFPTLLVTAQLPGASP